MNKQFFVHLSDKQRHLMSQTLIRNHVEYLKSLKLKGQLPFCGPCADGTAVMILEAPSQSDAESLVAADPFSQVDYYRTRTIVEIEEATLDNNFLLDEVVTYLHR